MSSQEQRPTSQSDAISLAALSQLSEVKGQLQTLFQLLAQQHESTNQRIADFRQHVDQRMSGVEGRLGTLEHNERSTALRVAGVSALSGAASSALVSAAIALVKGGGH